MKRALRWALAVLVLAAVGFGGYLGFRYLRRVEAASSLPTAPARKGEFLVIVRCRGELKAIRSATVIAPMNVPDLRIVFAVPNGATVKEGDVIIRFDPSSATRQLQQLKATLAQAQASLDQAVTQARIALEQSKLTVSGARDQVEKARLEASKAEVVTAIEAEEAKLDLAMAEQNQTVQERAADLDKLSNEAKIRSLTRTRDKAASDIKLTQYRLEHMELTTPVSGMVNFFPNYSQGFLNALPFKVGDQVWPGAAIAELPDLSTLVMEAKIEETDRGVVAVGQDALVRIDSLPESTFPAKLTFISPLTMTTGEYPPSRTFRGSAKLQQPDTRLRPAMNGRMDVVINRIPNAISVPSKALFTRNAKAVVYVPGKRGYEPVEVEVLARNPDEVAIRGISEGTRVTLVEPEKKEPGK
jgi:multidrug efflux pump subunit AcrA (membrane-fusion protein)